MKKEEDTKQPYCVLTPTHCAAETQRVVFSEAEPGSEVKPGKVAKKLFYFSSSLFPDIQITNYLH